jgi:chromosome segregation ATPase
MPKSHLEILSDVVAGKRWLVYGDIQDATHRVLCERNKAMHDAVGWSERCGTLEKQLLKEREHIQDAIDRMLAADESHRVTRGVLRSTLEEKSTLEEQLKVAQEQLSELVLDNTDFAERLTTALASVEHEKSRADSKCLGIRLNLDEAIKTIKEQERRIKGLEAAASNDRRSIEDLDSGYNKVLLARDALEDKNRDLHRERDGLILERDRADQRAAIYEFSLGDKSRLLTGVTDVIDTTVKEFKLRLADLSDLVRKIEEEEKTLGDSAEDAS